jgi:spore maturation protein SpmA
LPSLVAWLTALILIPTLVVSIFAALLQNSSSDRTIPVLAVTAAVMIIAGLIAYLQRFRLNHAIRTTIPPEGW